VKTVRHSPAKLIWLALLAATHVALWVAAAPAMVGIWLTHEAERRGVELTIDDVDLGVDEVTLRGVRAGFADAPEATLTSDAVVLHLGGRDGATLGAQSAVLHTESPRDVAAWAERALELRGDGSELARIRIDELTVELREESTLSGELEVDDAGARFTIARTSLRDLAPILGLRSESLDGTVAGSIALSSDAQAPLAHVDLTLRGLTAYPRELSGLVGRQTRIQADLQISDEDGVVRLQDVTVTSGVVALSGSGELWSEPDGLVALSARLRGAVACSDLSASALSAHVGPLAASLASELIRQHVTGRIGVTLDVQHLPDNAQRRGPNRTASSRRPALQTEVSVGCGLRL